MSGLPVFRPMSEDAAGPVLTEMGYVGAERPACGKRFHFAELADPMLDRSWITTCRLFEDTLGHLRVEKAGACAHFAAAGGAT